MTVRISMTSIRTTLLLSATLLVGLCAARETKQDPWKIRHQLVERLGAEGYRINTLTSETGHINDVLLDIRDMEVFPPSVTRLSDDNLVLIDKLLEKVDKKQKILNDEVQSLRGPLADAMSILREMVSGEAVEQMFSVIEKGDLDRINQMLGIRHHISAVWQDIDTLVSNFARASGIENLTTTDKSLETNREFFEVLRANLGIQYKEYYAQLAELKDSLVQRATPAQAKQMMRVEMKRIQEQVGEGQADVQLREKLASIRLRYNAKGVAAEVDLVIAKLDFMLGRYTQVVERVGQLPQGAAFDAARVQFTAQSLYMLEDYKRLHALGMATDLEILRGSVRNLLIWLTIESGLKIGATDDYSRLAARVEKDSSYAIHVLYSLAESFVVKQDWVNAQSVLENAQRLKPRRPVDMVAYRRVALARAQINYEMGHYEKSRDQFFALLNRNEANFEEALFGITWCYIALGDYAKAEVSLKKLINQSPQNPLAVESILTMAKRQLARAKFEWEKSRYYYSERKRLTQLLARLNTQIAAVHDSSAVDDLHKATRDVKGLLTQIENDPSPSEIDIRARYDQAVRTCELVQSYYASGSFRETVLSDEREQLLYQLDSLVLVVTQTPAQNASSGNFALQRSAIKRTKQLVQQSSVLRTRALLDRYQWERDNLDWKKTLERELLDSARAHNEQNGPDSLRKLVEMPFHARLDSLVIAGNTLDSIWYSRLTQECLGQLSRPLPENDEVFVRYQLGELYYAHENEQFVSKYTQYEDSAARYDSLMNLFHKGTIVGLPQEPVAPQLAHTGSMAQFQTALAKYPSNPLAPALLYSLAWCFSDLNRPDTAVALMERLALGWPEHEYAPQAWMYIGEFHFDNGELEDAVAAYQRVMQHPESKWFDDALYKFAWSQYRLSNPEKAISSFLALVDLGGQGGAGKVILEKESMDYIAISFSESDMTGQKGLERATKFVKRFGDEEKGTQILYELARVYKDQGRYDMSKATYRTLLKMYPTYRRNWMVESNLLALLEQDVTPRQHNDMKMQFFKDYNRTSQWAQAQTDTIVRNQADSAASEMLYDVGISYHQEALRANRKDLYEQAATAYENYIRHYPQSPKANECHYNFAEIKFSLGDYERAAEEYMAVSRRYPDSKYRETAAWNAIVASQNLLKREQAKN